jgi:hypothetical protein
MKPGMSTRRLLAERIEMLVDAVAHGPATRKHPRWKE